MQKKTLIGLSILLLGLVLILGWAGWSLKDNDGGVACTMEAKQCPDGSYVGRTGPNCEFAPCTVGTNLPNGYTLENYTVEKVTEEYCSINNDCETPAEYLTQSRCPFQSLCLQNKCTVVCPMRAVLETYTDLDAGIAFEYPESFATKYIHPFDWPPKVQIVAGPFSCVVAGNEVSSGGRTELHKVQNREYCVTRENEGAAGSMYSMYAYATETSDGRVAIFTFSTREVQCGNYPDAERIQCENERSRFDLDSIMHSVMGSLVAI